MDDWELLLEWTERGSDEAFRTLVERHLNLVYSVARRSVPTPSQAEEVTQTVFVILARKAAGLSRRTVLAGWLYRTTRFTAMEMIRTENRQQSRREELANMETSEPDRLWEQITPVLEEALDQIQRRDRDALVLRFMEARSLRDVGQTLGISEDAARKRVDRGLEKLRAFLARRGISTTATLLSGVLTTSAIHAVPAGLANSITAGAVASAVATSTSTLVKGTLTLMAWSKAKTGAVAVVVLLLCGATTYVVIRNAVPTPTPPTQTAASVSPPVDATPVADEGRLGGPGNRLPDWRAGLATAETVEQTNQIQKIWCVDNLKQVGFAAHIWATNHGDVFPSSLFSLKSEISPRYLTCPADDSRVEVTKWSEATPTNVTYMLVSPNLREKRPNVIILRCPVHGHVALSDGRVLQGDYLRRLTVAADNSVQ